MFSEVLQSTVHEMLSPLQGYACKTKLINMHEALSRNVSQGHQGHLPQCQGHTGQSH